MWIPHKKIKEESQHQVGEGPYAAQTIAQSWIAYACKRDLWCKLSDE